MFTSNDANMFTANDRQHGTATPDSGQSRRIDATWSRSTISA